MVLKKKTPLFWGVLSEFREFDLNLYRAFGSSLA